MPDFKPVTPRIVDPEGVELGIDPRPMGITTDDTRAEQAKETDGQPTVDFPDTTNPYIAYQSIDLLLSLQNTRSDAYDEMAFYIMGQTKELLFKGLHHELYNARERIKVDAVDDALFILERSKEFVKLLIKTWDVVATVSAEGFNQFRNYLDQASGQLSFMYRHVEFVLGNKDERLASAHDNVPHVWPAMKEALETPSLYDEIIALLHRQGFAISDAALDHDWTAPYQADDSVEQAWLDIYQNSLASSTLYKVGETLIELDELISQYHWRHYVLVAKTIGYKPGTGGSAGVEWLKHTTDQRYFPELWAIRTRMA
ncbi:MAG: tryptophan 2,3-dioxygenase [Actinobacteria bacterium]|jgi:tryptophan 2,3-dioxygenase|nr:tryptophan 2,3-dioxygenase [Actinomycetota bacterium]MBT3970177.1 tryptophan 2,3-dioxygenase [Actinomycetota bacterium]MBT4010537.1 tryptophan 2,3-dioxygenase [Actinomycetota bacterium]MBT4304081.1 tryptophan 2,3-dioxygenase [Actinomycetota bacterium]MBT4477657.1 tryptophan 2,3-dioxygenase [Actinomycetota bacterium]